MRNLKKILSLALALVMVMSLLTVAGAREFNDAADIEHTEAVEVMTALGVINGMGNNTFNPKGNVTRAEMAKMITIISLGNVEASAFLGTESNLTDINGHWGEAFIKYCYSQGIISGRGNGVFDPNANVTAAEAARMLLVAIGYNADVQVYTGSQWKINVIRDAQISHFFDDVAVTADKVLTRDEASQMMYNALINDSVRKVASRSITTGEVIWEYYPDDDPLLLKSFDARVYIGTFAGNYDSGATTIAGEIRVGANNDGRLEDKPDGASPQGTASFPYDYDIANIGEEVKVIFKDGRTGTAYTPDRNDTIYGVYKTGATTVYNITKDDLQSCSKTGKIKFGGAEYEIAKTANAFKVYVDYQEDTASDYNTAASAATRISDDTAANGWRKQSADTIKFVTATTGDDIGRIIAAYVVTQRIGKVTAISSDRITISGTGAGAIDIAGNNIEDGLAKDDVVVYTKLYKSDKDDAYFTVAKADAVEGTLTGFKKETGYVNVSVDGTTYEVNKNVKDKTTLDSITDDPLTDPADNNIGDTVRVYLVGGKVGAIQLIDENGGKYALVTDISNNGTVGSDLDPVKVVLLMGDGTKQTLNVHKDSTTDGTTEIEGDGKPELAKGTLVEYSSISGNSVKIKTVAKNGSFAATTNGMTYGHGIVTMTVNENVWDKTSRTLVYNNSGTTRAAVAATNAVLYVQVGSDYYAYNLRDLGNIKGTGTGMGIDAYTKDGQIVAAYVSLSKKPGSGTTGTLHGIVTSYLGNDKVGDDNYQKFEVAVENGEIVTVLVDGSSLGDVDSYIAKGKYVEFDRSVDGQYDKTDFTDLSKAVTGIYTPKADAWFFGASRDYNASANLLRFYRGTTKDGVDNFKGVSESSVTTTNDVKIIYVNAKDDKAGDETDIGSFNTEKGYANILFHLNDDKIVDVIIVETSEKESIAAGNTAQNNQFGNATGNVVEEEVSGGTAFGGLFTGNTTTATTNAPVTSSDGLTVPTGKTYVANDTVTTTGSAAFAVNGDATLNDTATLGGSAGVSVATGKTLTLNGNNNTVAGAVALTGTATVKVNGDTTLSGGVTGTGTIEVGKDATLTISSAAVAGTVKITGAGKVVANADISVDAMANVSANLGTSTTTEANKTSYTVDLSNVPTLSGTGHVTGFNGTDSLTDEAGKSGSTTGQFVKITVPEEQLPVRDCYVKVMRVLKDGTVEAGSGNVNGEWNNGEGNFGLTLFWGDNVTEFRIYLSQGKMPTGNTVPTKGTLTDGETTTEYAVTCLTFTK